MAKKEVRVNTPQEFQKALEIGVEELSEVTEKSVRLATEITTNEFVKDANRYAPMDVGTLKQSAILNSDYKKGLAIWKTPYVRRLWYGINFNFSKDSNPYAQAKWGEVAERKYNKKYKNIFNEVFNKGWK